MPPCSKHTDVDQGKLLGLIKSLVAEGHMHYSCKVRHQIAEGWYSEEDLRTCIFTATFIHKIEVDEMGTATDGFKYTILGRDTLGNPFYTCGKIILSNNYNRLYFFITAHEAR